MFSLFKKKEVVSDSVVETTEEKGFFAKALEKTIQNITSLTNLGTKNEKISFQTIEEILIESDMTYDIVELAMNGLPNFITREQLRHRLISLFEFAPTVEVDNLPKPYVQLIIGVNGAGKTTTIAKLTNMYKKSGKKVILGAGDTFRAAAIEQLSIWASKLDVPIIKTKQGHDSSAVAFDTIQSAVAKNMDNCIIDTAGRLQTQANLNKELEKIVKVCDKAYKGAPHQKLLILDGTQGNSAIAQAKAFNQIVGVDGIIVTKLDGTSKGGALFSISNELELPILYVGVGESADDLIEFQPENFVDSLLDGIYR
jgi:fused signal recognition particle receptor